MTRIFEGQNLIEFTNEADCTQSNDTPKFTELTDILILVAAIVFLFKFL